MNPALRAAPLLLAVLLVGPASAESASPPPATQLRREVVRKGAGEAILAVPLDPNVYAATRDGFPDLRVYDDRDREVPFVLEPVVRRRSTRAREEVPSRVDSLDVAEGEALEVVARLDDDAPEPDGATVRTPLVDFERRVRVLGSRDGRDWTPLNEGRIFDYSRYMDVRDVEVPFPAQGFRWFKLVFERESDEVHSPFLELSRSRAGRGRETQTEVETILRRPFRIDRIAFHRSVERPDGEEPATTRFPLDVRKVERDRERRETRIDLDALRQPLVRLTLRTTSRNFDRPARVLASAGGADGWREVGRGTLSLLQLGTFRREHLSLEIPETRADRLRIIVDDGDNPPLEVVGVDGASADHQLVFVAEPGRGYRLAYGSNVLQAPRYDAEAVLTGLGPRHRRETASLGPPVVDPDYRPGVPRPARFASPAWAMVALVAMAGVLLWALLLAMRHADKTPMDDFDR